MAGIGTKPMLSSPDEWSASDAEADTRQPGPDGL